MPLLPPPSIDRQNRHGPSWRRSRRSLHAVLVLLGAGLSGGCEDGDPSRDGQSFAGPTQPGSNPTQIIVNVATQGLDEDLSLSGYTVQLGGDARGVPINGQVRFQDLQPGTYTLTVTDLPPNCSVTRIVQPSGSAVTGQASVQAALPVGTTLSYRFEVGCAPNVGRIVVFNDTKGDPGVSTYSVIVAGPDQNVALGTPPNYNLYVDDIRVGPVTVQLGGIPAHCLVAGDNPVQVDLAFGQSITVPFYLDCSGTMGSLSVTTRTFGANPDPDGYLVNVADQTIGFSNSMTYDFGFLAVGDYVVTLYDVAQNCTVSPASPHTVTILPGVPTDLVFDVTCGAVGSVSVDLATGGVSLDPDGYTLVVDGRSQAVPINPLSPIVVDALPAGSDVEVRLDGIASDCGVAEANPQSVTVVQDVVTPAPGFTVTCLAPTPPVVFESDRDGDFDIYAMNPDGSGVVALTTNGAMDIDPSWSWDNQRIVFVSDRGGQSDVWVMNADGSNPIQITADAVVVGTAVVNVVAGHLDDKNQAKDGLADAVAGFVAELAAGVGKG